MIIVWGLSGNAVARDTPAAEILGGYSYVRLNGVGPEQNANVNLNGWNASMAFNANGWIGFVADFGGAYSTVMELDAKLKHYSYLLGPRISVRKENLTPFAQALFGAAQFKAYDVDNNEPYVKDIDFAMALGGGLDINVSDRFAVRPAQVDYFVVQKGGSARILNNFRYSAGIVFKLGSR